MTLPGDIIINDTWKYVYIVLATMPDVVHDVVMELGASHDGTLLYVFMNDEMEPFFLVRTKEGKDYDVDQGSARAALERFYEGIL